MIKRIKDFIINDFKDYSRDELIWELFKNYIFILILSFLCLIILSMVN